MTNNNFERDAVLNIQRYLRMLSFHNDGIDAVPLDGIFGDRTQRSLAEFQQEMGLEPTGQADKETWDALKAEYERSVAANSPPTMLALFPREPTEYEMTVGENSFLATAVQYLLSELERIYYFPPIELTGIYDTATSDTVREFQKRNGITVTGNVGRETWDALAIQHNLLLSSEE